MSSGTSLFFLFLIVNSIGVFVNHIDDTDETYGYWEPLHYLLFGHGMQTWEYAPSFSIRSYAFIMPLFYPLSLAKEYLGLDKIALFFLARLLLGTFFAYAQSRFILSIFNQKQRFPKLLARITCGSILFSPGIFLSSTSFLPSACASALVMLSIASWLNDQYYWSIAWGSVAVVWSGWPFVGLLFLPFGIHMLYDVFASNLRSRSNPSGGSGLSSFFRVMAFCIGSVVVVILVSLPAFAIDHKYYGRWTVPGLNILLYNALAGNGDELYGVEPMSYYAKNLFLNCNVSWLLFLLSPISLVYVLYVYFNYDASTPPSTAKRGYHTYNNIAYILSIYVAAYLWIGLLFSRPHKEERFMYPVYPLICMIGAHTLMVLFNLLDALCELVDRNQVVLSKVFVSRFTLSVVAASIVLLGTSRIVAGYRNYHGYIGLLRDGHHLIANHVDPMKRTSVCMGAEWHRFPSHFLFNDDRTRLQYIRDGFFGILPQPFGNTTFDPPLLKVNDKNREEFDRYIPLAECDYVLLTVDGMDKRTEEIIGRRICTDGLQDLKADGSKHMTLHKGHLHRGACFRGDSFQAVAAEDVLSYRVMQVGNGRGARALATVLRAFYLPYLSEKHVPRAAFTLLKHIRRES